MNHRDEFNRDMANELWTKLSDGFGNNQLVIETYVSNKNTIYAEYEIDASGIFELVSYGLVRMDGTGDKHGNGMANWVGFEIPFKDNSSSEGEFLNYCDKLAKGTAQLGFVGKINFDAIVCDDNHILFTEVNGRLGGCSHLAVLAKKCVGEDFLADATILTRNRVPITNFQRIAQLSESLSYPLANMGVIILNQDMLCLKQIEYMVYAPTKGAALSLEKEFLMQMANTEAYSV